MPDDYPDDLTISADAELWRRIYPKWVVPNGMGGYRVSSAAFDKIPDGTPTSILIAAIVAEDGRSPPDVLRGFDGYSLATVTAGDARGVGQTVVRAPEPGEKAHGYIAGRKTDSVTKRLARVAKWVVLISPTPKSPE